MTDAIRVVKAATHKPKPQDSELTFGTVFTDHMFVADFQEEKGWYEPRVEPYAPIPLDPAAAVLTMPRRSSTGSRPSGASTGRSGCSGPRSTWSA
jgi:hypothetical protein